MNEFLIQISSGRGPEECWRVVARVLEIFLKEARKADIEANVIHKEVGPINGTLLSVTVLAKGKDISPFLKNWEGSILWIAQSPFRKFHKRKNWFVGLKAYSVAEVFVWDDKKVVYESLRASGPGGQHVNKTESAIRARHIPSGISVVASERRSQVQNKAESLDRLKNKVLEWSSGEALKKTKDQWNQHNSLERGNPVRTFNDKL